MKPGDTARPAASPVRAAAPFILPISTILPSFTPTSPRNAGIPEPSTMRPLRINRSYVILVWPPHTGPPAATLPQIDEECSTVGGGGKVMVEAARRPRSSSLGAIPSPSATSHGRLD